MATSIDTIHANHSKSTEKQSFWQAHINQFNDGGTTKKRYCRDHNLNYDQFQYWCSKLKEHSQHVNLEAIPVTIQQPPTTNTVLCTLQIEGKSLLIHDVTVLADILARLLR